MDFSSETDNRTNLPVDTPEWGKEVYLSFSNDLLSKDRPFPCILGVEGFIKGHLRFAFCESESDSDSMRKLGLKLGEYARTYKSIGKYTSFVVFFKPDQKQTSIEAYENRFWMFLQKLHEKDENLWPVETAKDPNHFLWEFCFAGEPMFVVCNTPSHVKRKSRYSSTLMITFQPRWVFEGINGHTKTGQNIQKTVRERLAVYDEINAHPSLSWYGNPETLEWKQYFLRDDNISGLEKCPFQHKEGKTMAFSVLSIKKGNKGCLEEVVRELLPQKTGFVEVQYDSPGQEHPSHTHPNDEILHILEGSLLFTINQETKNCTPGDRIYLPKGTIHGSKAGEKGCLYVISILKGG